jgi:GNAT superfamily N-acetyltransferase
MSGVKGMDLDRIDPRELDGVTADRLAEVVNAAAAAAGQNMALMTGASLAAQAAYTHDDRPFDAMWLAHEHGTPVAMATLELPRWGNDHLGLVSCAVHPDRQRHGIGTTLLKAQADLCRAEGRSLLLTFSGRDTPGHALLAEHGFEVAQATAQRRLYPNRLDYQTIQKLADDAAAKAEADYELVRLDGPAPEEWVESLVSLFEAMNDAPLDDMDMAPDAFPVERIRRYETAMAKRRQHLYRLMARHRDSGAWAGHSILCVDELRPGVAMQEDTTVVAAHRGHRLGMWLKATMLLWMHEAQPDLETIDTWNAESNGPMIAVNDELGCVVNARGLALQLHL